jgi:hypothetical protein
MKLTGAAILVSRGMKVLQAAPAAYPYRSALQALFRATEERSGFHFFGVVIPMATGTCKHCGYSPVARSAPFCPKCLGPEPFPATRRTLILKLVVGLLLILAAAIFFVVAANTTWVDGPIFGFGVLGAGGAVIFGLGMLIDVIRKRELW